MNNMTPKQIERYLDILEKRNEIAQEANDKVQCRDDDFNLRNGQLVMLKEISYAISSVADVINKIEMEYDR